MLAAIAASAVALFVVSRAEMHVWQALAGSVVMGGGIAAMPLHRHGRDALCGRDFLRHRTRCLSVVLAIAISFVALKLAFRVRDERTISWRKINSALIMGSAIPLMHYTGMWAANFYPSGVTPDLTHAIGISPIGVWAISASAFFVLGGAIASSFFDRFIDVQRFALNISRERELYFRTMAEAVPEIIWTATPTVRTTTLTRDASTIRG